MARKEYLEYCWNHLVKPQIGYSFSIPHDIAYSIEAVQEANLATRYNPLFWACACLCVNAGSSATDFEGNIDQEDGEDEDTSLLWEEDVEEDDETSDEPKKTKSVPVNYPKIAKAISDAQLNGVQIMLPDINLAELDFIPDVEHNAIVYSLSTVTNINQDLANTIIAGRPYSSLEDFMNRLTLTPVQMISLIKAGSFDAIEQRPRQAIMRSYLESLARTKVTLKEKVTAVHLGKAIDLNIVPEDFNSQIRMFNYKKWVDKNEKQAAQKLYVIVDPDSVKFFEVYLKDKMTLGKEYDVVPAGYTVKTSVFEKKYKEFVQKELIRQEVSFLLLQMRLMLRLNIMLELEEDGRILEIHHDAGMGIETAFGKSAHISHRFIGVALLVWDGILRIEEDAVAKAKERYDKEVSKLKDLYAKRDEMKKKEKS